MFAVAILVSVTSSTTLSIDTTIFLAATATTLLPAIILLQLYLTEAHVLLAPARIAKLLEAITATIATISTIIAGDPHLAFASAAIGDVLVLAFLVLYRIPDADEPSPSPLPVASIEELEEN